MSRSLFVAKFVRIQAFGATHLKSQDFSDGAKATLNRDSPGYVVVIQRDSVVCGTVVSHSALLLP